VDKARNELLAKGQRQLQEAAWAKNAFCTAAHALMIKEYSRLSHLRERNVKELFRLSPYAFEDYVAALYVNRGWTVRQTPYSNDQGLDAIAEKDGKKVIVECKQYATDKPVGRRELQILYSAVIDAQADEGHLITTSSFTPPAVEYARTRNLKLVGGDMLETIIDESTPREPTNDHFAVMCTKCGKVVVRRLSQPVELVSCSNGHDVRSPLTEARFQEARKVNAKLLCEACARPMQRKWGRRGPYWVCTGAPVCNRTQLS